MRVWARLVDEWQRYTPWHCGPCLLSQMPVLLRVYGSRELIALIKLKSDRFARAIRHSVGGGACVKTPCVI
jgi:hypothetical protein